MMKGLLARPLAYDPRRTRQVWDTTPGGPFEVVVSEDGLSCSHPRRAAEAIRWNEVREILLVTTSAGPWAPDVWYVFVGEEGGCSVPTEAKGFERLWEVFRRRFPGMDYQAMIAAGTGDETKVIWRRERAL